MPGGAARKSIITAVAMTGRGQRQKGKRHGRDRQYKAMDIGDKILKIEGELNELREQIKELKKQLYIEDPESFDYALLEYDEDYYTSFC